MDIKITLTRKRIFMQNRLASATVQKIISDSQCHQLLITYFWILRWLIVIVFLLQPGLELLHHLDLRLTSSSTALPFYFPFNSCAWRRPFKPSYWPPNLILDLSDVPYAHDYCYYQSILQRQNHLPRLPMPFLILFLFVL